ncbi:putative ankyrin repeat protein RF_0381 [Halichondria panicea]|uniref:putative ankyrin repeat protein RF_0381 n=1 Tax=Halichondria panicea TaxID=6063 RepID=UPI00312B49EB
MAASHDLGQQLFMASRSGRVDKVERLLARGAPVNWRNSFGWTALHVACFYNHPDVVKILTQQDGIDVNVQNTDKNTPLHYACLCGYLKCVQLLMATGQCDLGAVNNVGLTPLREAVREGQLNTIKYLITECNVDINNSAQVVRILELTLKDEGDVTTKVNENNRLLIACKFGYTAIVGYLINQCNVDVNRAVTSDGLTPLGMAVREGKLDTIKYLITECNVDINSKLVYACMHCNDIYYLTFLYPNPLRVRLK